MDWIYHQKVARSTVKTIAYSGSAEKVHKRISPWFRERGIALTELQAGDIQDFYSFRLETVKATNPADKVERPQKEAF